MPELNKDLLEKTMQFCLDHPDKHNQNVWICGTKACFAGNALLLNGMGREELAELALGSEDEGAVGQKASRVLGLTGQQAAELFFGHNTVPMLQLMVKDLINSGELQDWRVYRVVVSVLDGQHRTSPPPPRKEKEDL